jgi:uncharacterized protein involved in response to NO
MNITDLEKEVSMPALWRQAFRPFFLFASLFAALALAIWALVLAGRVSLSPYGGLTFWHSHEMLFGFVAAIIVGFLLTAVQNWTGLRATHGWPLVGLFIMWLSGRIALVLAPQGWSYLVAVLDIGFLPLATLLLARLVWKVRQYRNLIFVPVLLLLATCNFLTHLSVMLTEPYLLQWGNYGAVMLITLLMTIVAGRVMPMFTANGTGTKKVDNLLWLERLVIGSTALIVGLYVSKLVQFLPEPILVAIFVLASWAHALRILRWKTWLTFTTPLVWSLHLAYWFIPVSLALFALHFADFAISASSALHGLTAGAMSSLILAMLARISLGHTGRPLQAHCLLSYAFALIVLAGISRFVAGLITVHWPVSLYSLSVILWSSAYGIYLLIYLPILTSPRPDGRPG